MFIAACKAGKRTGEIERALVATTGGEKQKVKRQRSDKVALTLPPTVEKGEAA